MLRFSFRQEKETIRQILCLGAHCDDIEIGCGGTILKLIQENPDLEFVWIVFSSTPQRAREARTAAQLFLGGLQKVGVDVREFRDSFFPFQGAEIKEFFEGLKKRTTPDVIFTHRRNDLHQDHRLISELTWNTFRDHLILEYEIPKYDGDLGSPNAFVHLDDALCTRKIQNVMSAFRSQSAKPWFTEDTFRSILRIRGIESNAPHKYAEAFFCRKLVL
jgi:LmbE family N-acetylglucosaminyl deacetylase